MLPLLWLKTSLVTTNNWSEDIALHLIKAKVDKKNLLSSSHQKYWWRALNGGKCRVSLYTHCNLSYRRLKKRTQEITGWRKAKRLTLLGADILMIFHSALYICLTFFKFSKAHITWKNQKQKKRRAISKSIFKITPFSHKKLGNKKTSCSEINQTQSLDISTNKEVLVKHT